MTFIIHGYEKADHKIEKQVYNAFMRDADSLEKYFAFGIANLTIFGNEMESDLILVGKTGVFVIEVKGGRIDMRDGDYYQNSKPMKKTPLKQASDNYWRIINLLEENGLGKYKDIGGGYVCIFPETTWDYKADIANNPLILDYAYNQSLTNNISKIINRFKEQNDKAGLYSGSLSVNTIEKIKSILVGNTKRVSDVRYAINLNKHKFIELSEEQYERYQEISENKHIIIKGPPGSGKTLLAYQIIKDSEKNKIRTLFICKNKALATHLQHKLASELNDDPRYVVIKNIDQLAKECADSSIDPKNFKDIIASATSRIINDSSKFDSFDYLLIDEGQDLMRYEYIGLIDVVVQGGIENGHWCMFIDFNQNLLNTSQINTPTNDDKELFELYFTHNSTIKQLTKNYRNTDAIQRTATILSHTQSVNTNGLQGESPEIKIFHNQDDEARIISNDINKLLDDNIRPSEITVLSFVGRGRSAAGRGLIRLKNGVKMKHISELNSSNISAADNAITYASVYEYKGLDNEVVLFTDIDDIDNSKISSALHLVGATRARNYYIMYVTPEVMKRLLDPNNGNLLHAIDPEYTK